MVTAATLLLKQDAQVHDWASKGTSLGGQARLSSWLFSLLRCKMSLILPKRLYSVTLTPLHHEIAPKPLPITDLHKDKTTTDSGTLPHLPPSDTLRNSDTTALQEGTDLPLAIRRPRRDLKPSTRLRESHEYLN